MVAPPGQGYRPSRAARRSQADRCSRLPALCRSGIREERLEEGNHRDRRARRSAHGHLGRIRRPPLPDHVIEPDQGRLRRASRSLGRRAQGAARARRATPAPTACRARPARRARRATAAQTARRARRATRPGRRKRRGRRTAIDGKDGKPASRRPLSAPMHRSRSIRASAATRGRTTRWTAATSSIRSSTALSSSRRRSRTARSRRSPATRPDDSSCDSTDGDVAGGITGTMKGYFLVKITCRRRQLRSRGHAARASATRRTSCRPSSAR